MTTPVRIVGIKTPWGFGVPGTDTGVSNLGLLTPTISSIGAGQRTFIVAQALPEGFPSFPETMSVSRIWPTATGSGGGQSASAF
jgi:hypothetical protein